MHLEKKIGGWYCRLGEVIMLYTFNLMEIVDMDSFCEFDKYFDFNDK